MGNTCFSDQNKPPCKSKDSNIKGLFLKAEIQTWVDEFLPNIRQSGSAYKQLIYCTKDSFLVVDQFSGVKLLQKEPLAKENQLVIQVQKKSPTAYRLTQNINTVYKVIKEPLQLRLNSVFVIGTTQYKLIRYQTEKQFCKKQLQSAKIIQSRVKEIKSMNTIKNLKQLSQIVIQQPCCRICMSEQQEQDNPLVSPCDCTGSMQFIHAQCWMQWAFKRTNKTDDYFLTHILKQECEICKKNLLESQIYKEIISTLLVSQSQIQPPFIILQGQAPIQKFKFIFYKKNYIVISFKNKSNFILGRGSKEGIPLQLDKSISRVNSQIYHQNNKIFVKDIGSKHGTCEKIINPIIVNQNQESQIYRYQNSFIKLSAKNNEKKPKSSK